MEKILKITNEKETFEIECVPQVRTLVSEKILQKFKNHEDVDAVQTVLEVLLMLSGIHTREWKNWKFAEDVSVS